MLIVEHAVHSILDKRRKADPKRSILVGVSGIDGAGKGYVTDRLAEELRSRGTRAVELHADGWLNLPHVRFEQGEPAEHFYRHALRLDEMFEELVLPLKAKRSHHVITDFAEETATAYGEHTYAFENVDVIVLECIFLFKRQYRQHFDVAIWIDCSFRTALERAVARGQEGLPLAETLRAYETIYFPAQRLHFERDQPRDAADFIVRND